MFTATSPIHRTIAPVTGLARVHLSLAERAFLAVGIIEIPIGIEKYFMYAENHAQWGAVGGFNISMTTICLAFLYARWGLALIRHELAVTQAIRWGYAMVAYLATVGLSVLAADVRHLALCDLFLLLQAYALFFYLANRLRSEQDLQFVIQCLAMILAIEGGVMIGQRAMGESLHGQESTIGSISFTVWEDGRTAGTLVSAVLAGSLMAIVWLTVLPSFIIATNLRHRLFYGVCLGIGMLGILFTQTRGAIITAGFGSMLIGGLMLTRGWLPSWSIKIAGLAVLVALVPLANIVQKRVMYGDAGSAESRTYLSAIAFKTIPNSPIFGHGAGNCHLACLPVANTPQYRSEWYYTIHCKYLLVWIETGLIGLVAFLAVLFGGIRHGLKSWFKAHPRLSPLGLGCAAAIAGHMLHLFVDIFNSRAQVQTLWVVLAIAAAVCQLTNSVSDSVSLRSRTYS